MQLPRIALASLALAGLSPLAPAQGLAQLRLEGVLDSRHGAWVEVYIGAMVQRTPREMPFIAYFGPGTTAVELGTLLAVRLERANFDVIPTLFDRDMDGMSLFIDNALFVRVRVGGGINATLTAMDTVPGSIRIFSPSLSPEPAIVHVSGGVWSPHAQIWGRVELSVPLETKAIPDNLRLDATNPVADAPLVAKRLQEAAIKAKWLSESPRGDAWRPIKMMDGSIFQGIAVTVESEGDWRIELEFPRGGQRLVPGIPPRTASGR
jgi:hypothetical protein